MTCSAVKGTMTSLLLLTSVCLMPARALHVHVHRVQRALDTQHSYSLALKPGHTDVDDSAFHTVTLITGGRRVRRTASKRSVYKDSRGNDVEVDLEDGELLYGVLLDAGSSSTKVKVRCIHVHVGLYLGAMQCDHNGKGMPVRATREFSPMKITLGKKRKKRTSCC